MSKLKSSVFFSPNTHRVTRFAISSTLGVKEANKKERYLGNPLFFSKSRCLDFNFLKENVVRRLGGWKTKLLSRAGRTTLIKSVMHSIPSYTMSTFQIPKSICHKLDALARKCLWLRSFEKNHHLSLKAWESLCLPKERGGLGFRRMEDLNKALISKLSWKVASNEARTWVQSLISKYCTRTDFWSTKVKPEDSIIWKGIAECREFLVKGACI